MATDEQILSQTRKYGNRRGNNVTDEVDILKPEQLHHLVSSVQGKVVCRHVGSLRSQIYICSNRKIPPLLSYLDHAAAVDNKEGVVGEVCCRVQHPEGPRHLVLQHFFSQNLVFI